MHFPPSDDGDELLVPMERDIADDGVQEPSRMDPTTSGWTEPALRSDRMCWSLVGMACTLAYELGIFGNYADGTRSGNGGLKRKRQSENRQRADCVERLLYIYTTQTSGRLGFPSAFPGYVGDTDPTHIEAEVYKGKPSYPWMLGTHLIHLIDDHSTLRDSVEIVQELWVEITAIMKTSNAKLFCSRKQTTELIQSGEYIGLLQQLLPILAAWKKKLQSSDGE